MLELLAAVCLVRGGHEIILDNVFDVGTLLEDAETKTAALERVEELEESLSTVRMVEGRQVSH